MKELVVKELEAGQRLDKFLHKYMKEAPNSFLYKMMRKKNIVLNGKKVTGNEILKNGDSVKLFLSDETIEKFKGNNITDAGIEIYQKAYAQIKGIRVVEEFEDVLFVDKPSGVLSQRADGKEVSVNEWLIGYLLSHNSITREELQTFKPSVCNRLDRNTSGLLICSKTLTGSQEMARILKDRSLHKYYRCIVKGKCSLNGVFEAFLYKDEGANKVSVYDALEMVPSNLQQYAKAIKTGIRTIKTKGDFTELEIELFTGKTHQIRAQMEKLGFPLVGDIKYSGNKSSEKTGGQLLHAYRLVFPELDGKCEYLSGKEILCEREFTF